MFSIHATRIVHVFQNEFSCVIANNSAYIPKGVDIRINKSEVLDDDGFSFDSLYGLCK